MEERKTEIEALLADPDTFKDNIRSQEFTKEYGSLNDKLKNMYERWEEVSAHIENHNDD